MISEDLMYRQVVTLRDGARVLLRPLTVDDRQALLDLFVPVPPDERRFMRHNVNNPEVVNSWVDNLNYEKIFPLIALVGDRIVGVGTLHFHDGAARHRGEIRIIPLKRFPPAWPRHEDDPIAHRICQAQEPVPARSAGRSRPYK